MWFLYLLLSLSCLSVSFSASKTVLNSMLKEPSLIPDQILANNVYQVSVLHFKSKLEYCRKPFKLLGVLFFFFNYFNPIPCAVINFVALAFPCNTSNAYVQWVFKWYCTTWLTDGISRSCLLMRSRESRRSCLPICQHLLCFLLSRHCMGFLPSPPFHPPTHPFSHAIIFLPPLFSAQ